MVSHPTQIDDENVKSDDSTFLGSLPDLVLEHQRGCYSLYQLKNEVSMFTKYLFAPFIVNQEAYTS